MAKKSDRNIVPGALDAKREAQVNLKDLDTPLGPDLALPHVGNRLVELSAQASREPNRIWDRAGGKGISGQTRSHLEHIYGSDRLGLEAAINRAANPQATEQIRGMNQRAARRSADPTYGYDGNRGALAQRIRDEGGYVPGTPSSPGVTGTPDSDRLYTNPKDPSSYFEFSRADFPNDRYPGQNSPTVALPSPNASAARPGIGRTVDWALRSGGPNRRWIEGAAERAVQDPKLWGTPLDGSAFNAHDFIKTREESSLIPGLITDPIMNELLATMLA
jgi:hypothetical protein